MCVRVHAHTHTHTHHIRWQCISKHGGNKPPSNSGIKLHEALIALNINVLMYAVNGMTQVRQSESSF